MENQAVQDSVTGKRVDVAIVGGGPGGSTMGCFLKKYMPELEVAIFEREKFPREHIGESQLPPIGAILEEIGCYGKVESAGFPIKIGVTFRWGASNDLWDFELMPTKDYAEQLRPRPYFGQSKRLAFQVDRAAYDQILLDHAREYGCHVFEETAVTRVESDGDRIVSLGLSSGKRVEADLYVDASGNAGTIRRAMGVEIDAPTKLKNVAFWDYWDNAEWATQFPGGATRVLILSIGCGWIWYIPIGLTRTSIGFVCPADYYKESGKSPAEIYEWALSQEPMISELTQRASRDGEVRATRDWSFLASRMTGENWLLVGETAGFADPILSAGLTLTQTGAREAAFTAIEMKRGSENREWLRGSYEETQSKRITQHIRFADFWYSANGIFTDLQGYTSEIARDAGLDLSPKKAFQWLGTGGFAYDNPGQVGIGGLDLAGAKQVAQIFLDADAPWEASKYNVYRLNVSESELQDMPVYLEGRVLRAKAYVRGAKRLPLVGLFEIVVDLLTKHPDIQGFLLALQLRVGSTMKGPEADVTVHLALQVLEVLVNDGWVLGRLDPTKPRLSLSSPREGHMVHANTDMKERVKRSRRAAST